MFLLSSVIFLIGLAAASSNRLKVRFAQFVCSLDPLLKVHCQYCFRTFFSASVYKMDYISKLPDCVLSYILSMLSIKDRLKTKILCKRWSHLTALTRDLNFDVHNMLGGKELLEGLYMRSLFPKFDLCRDKFVNRVDQFLNNFQGTKIDSFLLNFYLHRGQSNIIDQWISFAIGRGVGRIDLLLFGRFYFPHRIQAKLYKFPFALFRDSNSSSTLNHLSLQHCIVSHPTNCDFISLKKLRSLALEGAQVDQMFFTSLLSNCPLLEKLCLDQCKFKSSLPKIVKIISLSLCHLEFRSCTVLGEENIQITSINININVDCPKLTSLRHRPHCLQTLHFNTPMLKSIDYSGRYDVFKIFALFATLPELEILRFEILVPLELVATTLKITPLKHLIQLNISICSHIIEGFKFSDVLWILTIIQASPLLQKLSAMVEYPKFLENQKEVKDIEMFSHDRLKVIELSGCVGNWYEAEFVMNVLNYAHKLERVVLSPYWRKSDLGKWQSDPMWFQNGRERIIKKLQAEEVVGLAKLTLI